MGTNVIDSDPEGWVDFYQVLVHGFRQQRVSPDRSRVGREKISSDTNFSDFGGIHTIATKEPVSWTHSQM